MGWVRTVSDAARRCVREQDVDGATRTVDILLTHAPPRGVGDGSDPPHQGFPILNALTRWLRPALLLHGHVDPAPAGGRDHWLDGTIVRNVTGWQLMLVEPVIGLVEDKARAR